MSSPHRWGVSFTALGFVLAAALVAALPVLAQTSFTIEDIGGQVGLGTADLKDTVINIIRWVLGILALVAVSFIIIGGFMWMTAAGNDERIDKAKKTISAAVIGIVIVILAWALVIFVAGTTANVTQ
ncbi:MAG: hypothetical protein HYZ09_03590 [Candidatus Kerfeldbacteria bacterium]|nr:hypothetical protein [Candidatus Kerfeldbacteria bacterium]